MNDNTQAIADTAATAAVAEVEAEAAGVIAEETAQELEQHIQEDQTEWRITSEMYSACEARITTLEQQVAELQMVSTQPEPEPESEATEPPTLEMDVTEPAPEKVRRGLFTRQTHRLTR